MAGRTNLASGTCKIDVVILALIEKLPSPDVRLWYAQQAVEHRWSCNVLVHQIESNLYVRMGKATTNFERVLPAPQSDLARQILKDPYNFEFLELHKDAEERDLERGLINHIRKFLLELGAGFAFIGSQCHLEFDGEDYYVDLLFTMSSCAATSSLTSKPESFCRSMRAR